MAADRAAAAPSRTFGRAPQPTRLLTWGTSGRRHGIDHAIRAIALLGERRREIRYLITGAVGTDPSLLTRLAWEAGVASSVRIDTANRTPDSIAALVASASVVIVCDDPSPAQRPTLLATAALGRPMIATKSQHNAELVTGGATIVVPYGDPVALAAAIIAIVDDPAELQEMTHRAARIATAGPHCGSETRQPSLAELVSAALEPADQ